MTLYHLQGMQRSIIYIHCLCKITFYPLRRKERDGNGKGNTFKFTDHQNHYKGYYNQLRKNYVDKFYNMTLTQRQKFFYNDPEAHESKLYEDIPPRVRQPLYRGQEHHEPKQIQFRELIRDP